MHRGITAPKNSGHTRRKTSTHRKYHSREGNSGAGEDLTQTSSGRRGTQRHRVDTGKGVGSCIFPSAGDWSKRRGSGCHDFPVRPNGNKKLSSPAIVKEGCVQLEPIHLIFSSGGGGGGTKSDTTMPSSWNTPGKFSLQCTKVTASSCQPRDTGDTIIIDRVGESGVDCCSGDAKVQEGNATVTKADGLSPVDEMPGKHRHAAGDDAQAPVGATSEDGIVGQPATVFRTVLTQ